MTKATKGWMDSKLKTKEWVGSLRKFFNWRRSILFFGSSLALAGAGTYYYSQQSPSAPPEMPMEGAGVDVSRATLERELAPPPIRHQIQPRAIDQSLHKIHHQRRYQAHHQLHRQLHHHHHHHQLHHQSHRLVHHRTTHHPISHKVSRDSENCSCGLLQKSGHGKRHAHRVRQQKKPQDKDAVDAKDKDGMNITLKPKPGKKRVAIR